MTKREIARQEREARLEQEQIQEHLRQQQLLEAVLEKVKSGSRLLVTPEEAGRLIVEASRTKKKYHGPKSIVRAFRAF